LENQANGSSRSLRDGSISAGRREAVLTPDRAQIELFVNALFRYADRKGFVSLRTFYEDDAGRPFRITPTQLTGGLSFLIEAALDDATRAANYPKAVVFCPPIAAFAGKDRAREQDVIEAFAISIESDTRPREARETLEALLGPATAVVASGGKWTNRATGEVEDKVHLHWRLAEPARGPSLSLLKTARDLAARLVGGDPSNKPVCHPIRWPGSWHRKGEPVLCSIETASPDAEIDLAAALDKLKTACPQEPAKQKTSGNGKDHSEGTDWRLHIANILAGEGYHDALVRLAAKMLATGMSAGAVTNLLRGLMENSPAPHDGRWQARFDDIARGVETAQAKFQAEGPSAGQPDAPLLPLPYINMSNWDNEPVPDQAWGVLNRFPLHQAAVFSGEGAAGKSTLALQLGVAHVLGVGSMPEQGPAIVIDAVDDPNVMHRRLAIIRDHYRGTSVDPDEEITFRKLIEAGLHPVSLVNEDATLAVTSRGGKIEPTTLYRRLLKDAGELRPKLISIASSANVYAGNEIDRSQVQQFVSLLTRLAIAANGYVILIAHPSLTGITTDTGLSGTTQWHNAARARAYLKSIKPAAGEQPDNDLRELVFKKNQYGRVEDSVVLRYQSGLYLPVPGIASLDKASREAAANDVFLDLLRRFTKENRFGSSSKGVIYAPFLFAKEEEAKKTGMTSKDLEAAMARLFKADMIWNEDHGRSGRHRYHIALKGRG
jgi:RecA-family ATPase